MKEGCGMVISHNISSLNASRQVNYNISLKKKSAEKLSSGYRINRAADDAAGLQISEKMRQQIRGLKRGEQNIMEGVSWVQVADGAMNEATEMVQRIRELAVYAANGTHSKSDREAIDQEVTLLKQELDQMSDKVVFNEQKVFDKYYVSMDVEGILNDMEIFDATYDDSTGKVTYGGIIFQGKRISWDTMSRDMVKIDPQTGKQIFKEGNYHYRDPETGAEINFSCKDGEEVPKFTRTIGVSADKEGVSIDGKLIEWKNVKDEDGISCGNGNYHGGDWSIDYSGIKIKFFLGMEVSSLDDMIRGINACSSGTVSYKWESGYSGSYEEQAVDVQEPKRMQFTNDMKNQGITTLSDLTYIVRAGSNAQNNQDGIWLEDKNGNRIDDSYISWNELGIYSWNSGKDINDSIVYKYADTDGDAGDTNVEFSFQLSDITSVDSVIDGLDGMVVRGNNFVTNYKIEGEVAQDSNIIRADVTSNISISHQEEEDLGRDYDQKIDEIASENMKYDATNKDATLAFLDQNNNAVIEMTGDVSVVEDELKADLQEYMDYVIRQKTKLALAGKDPQSDSLGTGSLADVLGTDKITTSGYFNDIITIDETQMSFTDSPDILNGQEYPTAFVDFAELGTSYQLTDLEDLGFNSTCKTCDNHYSIKFVSGGGDEITTEGYQYTFQEQEGNHYLLEIDIDSLQAKGISTGTDMAEAMVAITSQCYDFHYTQYAAEGSKLYVFDDRSQDEGAPNATFDTVPFGAIDRGNYSLAVAGSNGEYVNIDYEFDYGDLKDSVIVEMKESSGGAYILDANGAYVLDQDPVTNSNLKHYDLSVDYKDKFTSVSTDQDGTIDSYAAYALTHMITNTKVSVESTDYTYVGMEGDEKSNVAIGAEFESVVTETLDENVLQIQNSGTFGDVTKIPRIALSTAALNLTNANVRTEAAALKAMKYADYALAYLSEKRSTYGAYQNRLEHAYAINANTGENLQASESRIRDTDMAEEMVNYSKSNILEQVSQAMLAQANSNTDAIIGLLQF